MKRRPPHPSSWVVVAVYSIVGLCMLLEQFGKTTSDTRLDLTNAPGAFLRSTFSLWNPRVSLGELQNQAYGYLFPQGPYYLLGELAHVPAWITERFWSWLLFVVAAEGIRRVALAMQLSPWSAAAAGLMYAASPRVVAEVGVRSAEILPTAVIPWVLLPVLLVVVGRMKPRTGALLSALAFTFMGAVNATATVAPLPLVGIFILWAVRRRAVKVSFALMWGAALGAVSVWWLTSLTWLGHYSPPFFDYVEDAPTTTFTSGFEPALRGAGNWVDYIVVAGRAWWPSGYEVSYDPWLVVSGGLAVVAASLGLVLYRGVFRAPLLISAALGFALLTLGHTGPWSSPLSGWVQSFLDEAGAPLRNVHKADPLLRVPLALGLAAFLGAAGDAIPRVVRRGRRAKAGRAALVALVVVCLVAMSAPVLQGHLRTPGWKRIPTDWQRASAFLDAQPGQGATWVVPGTGFGIQRWGWTMEEPLEVLGSRPWITRSQVPLTPGASIRMQTALEGLIETGSGSPYLGDMLQRIGIRFVLVRHDLDAKIADAPVSSLVSIALARSRGISKVAQFGAEGAGPALEVFEVDGTVPTGFRVRDVRDTLTVGNGVEDAITAVGAGLVGSDQGLVVRGDSGWKRPVDILGDGYRRRERNFGRVHDTESSVMAADEPYQGGRKVANYPGAPGSKPVVAQYLGFRGITASTSSGYARVIGPVRAENGPFAAVDGDPYSYWQSAYLTYARDQWLDLSLDRETAVPEVRISMPVSADERPAVRSWRVTVGRTTRRAEVNPRTGVAVAELGSARGTSVHLAVATAVQRHRTDPVAVSDIAIPGVHFQRTLRVPTVPEAPNTDFVFTSQPPTRSCVPTLLGPDCSPYRARASDESTGIDRTFTVGHAGTWDVDGLVVARASKEAYDLTTPAAGITAKATSWYDTDPTVAPSMAIDADPSTQWLAAPQDRDPTLTVHFPTPRRFTRIGVTAPVAVAQMPTSAVIRGGGQVRRVALDGFGLFTPLRASTVHITFSRRGKGNGRPIGMADLYLGPGRLRQPLDGAAQTGAFCGYGPNVVIDGKRYPTAVTGLRGDVFAGGRLGMTVCRGNVALTAGVHRMRVVTTPEFQPVQVGLRSIRKTPLTVQPSREVKVISQRRTRQVLSVSDGEEALLSVPRNFNSAWVAKVGDRTLKPQEVEGWAQGWLLPDGVFGKVVVTFAPERPYEVGLVGGLALMVMVQVAAVAVATRHRRSEGVPLPSRQPRHRRRLSLAVAGIAAMVAVVAWFLAGPVVAGGVVVGFLAQRLRRSLVAAATVLLLTGTAVAGWTLQGASRYPTDAADFFTAAGLGLAVALALWARPNVSAP